jgi:hypothetical protein
MGSLSPQTLDRKTFYPFLFILTYQTVELFDPMLSALKVAKLILQGKLP